MDQETFGRRIRRKREELGIGLNAAARDIGISPTYLSVVERDTSIPPVEGVIRRIAKALGDNFFELMRMAGRIPEGMRMHILEDPDVFEFLRKRAYVADSSRPRKRAMKP